MNKPPAVNAPTSSEDNDTCLADREKAIITVNWNGSEQK